MKPSIIRRWKLMRFLEDRGPHWTNAPGEVEAAETRAYRRDIAHVDEVLRQEAHALNVAVPAHVERRVMAAVRSCAREERVPHSPWALRAALVMTAASILLCCVWAWSRSVQRTTTARSLAGGEPARHGTIRAVGHPELTSAVMRTQLSVLDRAVEEPLRTEARHMQKDVRAMAANTASWLPKPWFALLTGERAASR